MSDNFREILRAEICKALMAGEFTPAVCSTVMRLTEAARDFIRATSQKPEDFAGGTDHPGLGEGPGGLPTYGSLALGPETFGAKMLREILPVIQQMNQAKSDTPEKLVEGIAAAEAAGLDDVAEQLRKRLGVAPAIKEFLDPTTGPNNPHALQPCDVLPAGTAP